MGSERCPTSAARSGTAGRWRLGLLGLLPLLAGCGPSPQDLAQSVLVCLPVSVLAGLLLLTPLWGLWRRQRTGLRFSLRPALGFLAVLVLLALASSVGMRSEAWGYLWLVFYLSGCGYLALVLVTWRVWLGFDPERAFGWASLPAILLLLLPTLPLALFDVQDSVANPLVQAAYFVWAGLGGWGITPGVLFLGLLVEVLIRGRRPRVEAPRPLFPDELSEPAEQTG